jgi:hypothetical protein
MTEAFRGMITGTAHNEKATDEHVGIQARSWLRSA